MSALFGVPVDAAYHLVYALANILTPVLGGLAAVAGIVVFTAAVRLIVMPLSFRALRGQAAMARLAPQIQDLRKRHARQPERLQRELSALYKREGTSAFAGLAPILAQWPVFSVLYLLFRSPNVAGGPNRLLSRDMFGVPLGDHWLGAGPFGAHGAVFLGVFAVLAAICWLSVRVARRMSAPAAAPGAGSALGVLGRVLPYLTVVIAAFAPLAAAVYLLTSTAWGVGERWVFARAQREGTGGGTRSGTSGQTITTSQTSSVARRPDPTLRKRAV
jgi:YidC/Oxa1 family membrane protein insertase